MLCIIKFDYDFLSLNLKIIMKDQILSILTSSAADTQRKKSKSLPFLIQLFIHRTRGRKYFLIVE